MKEHFGWVQASKMAGIYVHLSGRDVDNALLKIHGLVETEEDEEQSLKIIKCPRCKEHNPPTNKFCSKCWLALDTRTAMKLDEEIMGIGQLIKELIQDDPELQAKLKSKMIERFGKQ
jgi:hypothetical protein